MLKNYKSKFIIGLIAFAVLTGCSVSTDGNVVGKESNYYEEGSSNEVSTNEFHVEQDEEFCSTNTKSIICIEP